jgi:predicted RNA-binding Zn ribbon-like protein
MVENVIQTQIFELTGGRLCLDFTNTIEDRPSGHPHELLNNYSDLVSWGKQAQVLTEHESQQLLARAERHPGEASSVLAQAIALREAIYRIFKAVAEDTVPEADDLVSLSAAIAEAMTHARIVARAGGFTWEWIDTAVNLDRMLWPAVRSAEDLLISDELDAVRVCASDTCNWLFIDTSKNHSRRWCDMKSCGNRAKARRFYSRKKGASVDV